MTERERGFGGGWVVGGGCVCGREHRLGEGCGQGGEVVAAFEEEGDFAFCVFEGGVGQDG